MGQILKLKKVVSEYRIVTEKMHILKSLFAMELLWGIPILDYSWIISRLAVLNEIPVENLIEQIKNKSPCAVHQQF